jgi:hypothetical protein
VWHYRVDLSGRSGRRRREKRLFGIDRETREMEFSRLGSTDQLCQKEVWKLGSGLRRLVDGSSAIIAGFSAEVDYRLDPTWKLGLA